jgi:hypothetical protein
MAGMNRGIRQPADRQPLVLRYRQAAPGGEALWISITACAARQRISAEHAGKDIDRGGAWWHHQGGIGLRSAIPNRRRPPLHRQLPVTRLDHLASA